MVPVCAPRTFSEVKFWEAEVWTPHPAASHAETQSQDRCMEGIRAEREEDQPELTLGGGGVS